MANIVKLNYTAQEIDEKLGMVDVISENVVKVENDVDTLLNGGGVKTFEPALYDGRVNYTNGEISNDVIATFKRTDYITIGTLKTIKIDNEFFGYGNYGFAFYDENKMYLGGNKNIMSIVDIPSNAMYIMFTSYNADGNHSGKTITIESDIRYIAEIKNDIKLLEEQSENIDFILKTTTSNIVAHELEFDSATRIQSSANKLCVLKSMPLTIKGKVSIKIYNGLTTEQQTRIYLLNSENIVVSVCDVTIPSGIGTVFVDTDLYVDGNEEYYLAIKDTKAAFICNFTNTKYNWGLTDVIEPNVGDSIAITRTFNGNTIACEIYINALSNALEVVKNTENISELTNKINRNKYVHYSVDDVVCWHDLIVNANTYNSLFDSPYFAFLKSLHEQYGACVTLNCFIVYESYSIADVPTKFAEEFKSNKNWLRFSFHGTDTTTLFDEDMVDELTGYYNTFVNAIYQMTGDADCIDRVVRLSSFKGTLNNVKALRDCTCGISGLLCADNNNTMSYYLAASDNTYIRNHCKLYDSENHMWFLNTQRRLDASDVTSDTYNSLSLANANPIVELFWHESQVPTTGGVPNRIKGIMQWFNSNGYTNAFSADVLHIN